MIKKTIKYALQYNCSEARLVVDLKVTHLELRQFCYSNELDLPYHKQCSSLQEEIEVDCDGWPLAKIAKKYFITVPMAIQLRYNTIYKRKTTDVNVELIKELLAQDMSIYDVSEHLNHSLQVLRRALGDDYPKNTSHKLTQLQKDEILEHLEADSMTNKQLAALYDVSTASISYMKRKHLPMPLRKQHNRVTKEDVKALHNQGLSQGKIAQKLDITQPTVSRLLNK